MKIVSFCFVVHYFSQIMSLFWFQQINEFVKLGGDQLVPYYADILGAILPCISDKEEKIRVVCFLLTFFYSLFVESLHFDPYFSVAWHAQL